MFHRHNGVDYLINLVDCPGHVDFSYEVSRSLAACQGALLLVDAAQGVEAQTVANFWLAFGEGLKVGCGFFVTWPTTNERKTSRRQVIPVMNKVDLKSASPDAVREQLQSLFDLPSDSILPISAKTGLNVDTVLPKVIEEVPGLVGSKR